MLTTLPCTRQRTTRSFRARIATSWNSILSVPSIIAVLYVVRAMGRARRRCSPSPSDRRAQGRWRWRKLVRWRPTINSFRSNSTSPETTDVELRVAPPDHRAARAQGGGERGGVQVERDANDGHRHVHRGVELAREPPLRERAERRARAAMAGREAGIDQRVPEHAGVERADAPAVRRHVVRRAPLLVCPVDYGEHLNLSERFAPSSAPSEGITIAGLSGGAYMRVDGAARGHARKFQREGCPHAEGPHPRR